MTGDQAIRARGDGPGGCATSYSQAAGQKRSLATAAEVTMPLFYRRGEGGSERLEDLPWLECGDMRSQDLSHIFWLQALEFTNVLASQR